MNHTDFHSILSQIPVGINGFYGDSLQPSQWKNSLSKLENLYNTNHKGDIMIPTKYKITDEQLNVLSKNFPDIWVFYAITGLNETNLFSLEDSLNSYLQLCSKLTNVVCVIRPIVEGKNDSINVLLPILETVSKGRKLLTYRGFRDPFIKGSQKYTNDNIFTNIEDFCHSNNILTEQRCVSIISKVKKQSCYLDINLKPQNIDLIKFLGYNVCCTDNSISILDYKGINEISKGDISFIHMLSKCKPTNINYEHSEILSVDLKNQQKLVCTSSWFAWSTQTSCDINCWYCFADYKSNVRIKLTDFGCNPYNLLELLK